ncbi:MAG: SDR family NAD(P)-dependent oxidoreductase [Asgard group archaeon]|nr:SDR family NAD(P)-dependent oxidoreductase [Asgard group archaeon]
MNLTDDKLKNVFQDKKILVTGGTGSVGAVIVQRLLKYNPKVIRVFCNDENAIFQLKEKLKHKRNLRYLLGDIRDKERLTRAMEDIEIIYHAAALKHVPLCEYNPFEAVKTNVLGTQNLIDGALLTGVKKVINISTDKAVNPVNTMGATKLLAEKLITDANNYRGLKDITFSSVRFGNVLYSRGSVVEIFERNIKEGKPINITDPKMTRFMMSLPDATDLIFQATIMAKGFEIFILKMPIVRTGDLADAVIDDYTQRYKIDKKTVKKEIIGARLGEKMFEELMTEIEAEKAFETEKMFIVFPKVEDLENLKANRLGFENAKKCQRTKYNSYDSDYLSIAEIKKLLKRARKSYKE